MINIQHKINLVRKYILERKGVDIGNIIFTGDCHSRELSMLEHAYKTALYFYANKV